MLSQLAALILAVAANEGLARCDLHHLSLCDNMNQLIRSEGFDDTLEQFIGDQRANWIFKNSKEIRQVYGVLGAPPGDQKKISANLIRFSACRAHSCSEKGAMFLSMNGEIKSVAVLHFNCGNKCSEQYTLTILMHEEEESLVRSAKDWANEILDKHDKDYPDYPLPRWDTVEVLVRP